MKDNCWGCKVGFADFAKLPDGADAPMRKAVSEAFYALTGEWPAFLLSGWSEPLTAAEEAAVRYLREKPR